MRRWSSVFALLCFAAVSGVAENRDMLVTTSWLRQHLHDRKVTVVDVGEAPEFAAGHISGAHNVPLSSLLVTRDGIPNELPDVEAIEHAFAAAGVPNHGRLVVYAREAIPAARAFYTLDYAGHGSRVAILDGGYPKWKQEGLPMSTGAMPRQLPTAFIASPHLDALITTAALRRLVDCQIDLGARVAIIDVRSPEEFTGATRGNDVPRGGHVPGALNIPWRENFLTGPLPVLRPAADLVDLYRGAFIRDDATVVPYCRTGMQAAVTYFVMRYLGRDVHLYDASFVEWSRTQPSMIVGPGSTDLSEGSRASGTSTARR